MKTYWEQCRILQFTWGTFLRAGVPNNHCWACLWRAPLDSPHLLFNSSKEAYASPKHSLQGFLFLTHPTQTGTSWRPRPGISYSALSAASSEAQEGSRREDISYSHPHQSHHRNTILRSHICVASEDYGKFSNKANLSLNSALPGEQTAARLTTKVCTLSATQNGRGISILPSASSLQERASSRSRAVDGSMVKIQSFLGKIEDIISDATNKRNFTPL